MNVMQRFLVGSAVIASASVAVADDNYQLLITTNEAGVVTVTREKTAELHEFILFPFLDPEVTRVEYRTSGCVARLNSTEPSTYTGGTYCVNAQLRPYNSGVFGSGPVYLKGGSSLVGTEQLSQIAVTNKVIFEDTDSWALGVADHSLILHSIGSTAATPYANLGRSEGKACSVALALDGEGNEPLAGVRMRGELDILIDGGTLRAAPSASGKYFIETNTKVFPKTVSASDRGFAFDAAAGADVEFGMPLAVKGSGLVTNCVESVAVSNGSFEDNPVNWTEVNVTSSNGGKVGVLSNGNTTWVGKADHLVMTPYGSKFFTIRGGHALYTEATTAVPRDGEWYLTFVYAPRNGYYSNQLDSTVTVSNADTAVSQTLTHVHAGDSVLDFREVVVGPFDLTAGNYHVRVEATNWRKEKDNSGYSGMSYDNFEFRRLAFAPARPPITKTGAGRLVFADMDCQTSALAADEGDLALCSSSLSNTTAAVKGGATLELIGTALDEGSTVSVAEGGTLAFGDVHPSNLIANASFESNSSTSKDVSSIPAKGWELTCVVANANNNQGRTLGGVQGYGGNVTANGPAAAAGAGNFSAAIREQCRMHRKFTIAEAGQYRLSFVYARRKDAGYNDSTMVLYPQIDGESIDELKPPTAAFQTFAATVSLEPGEHELGFFVDGGWREGAGPMAFIDLVRLGKLLPAQEVKEGATVDMASGSTLRLDNVQDLTIADFRVDGRRINGKRGAIKAAGVTVVGDGQIRVGERLGLMIIFR